MLRAALDPEKAFAGRGGVRLDAKAGIAAEALRGNLVALNGLSWAGREVDVVENAVVVGGPQALIQQGADDFDAVGACCLKRVIRSSVSRPIYCDSAMAGMPCRAASIAAPMVPE